MSKHTNGFGHARLLAAGLVLYSHHFALWALPQPGSLGTSLGGIGVAIFFAMSGYLVTQSLEADPHTGRFLARRALRIMPGLTVNVLVCVLVVGLLLKTVPLSVYVSNENFYKFFLNIVFHPHFALPGVLVDAPYPYAVNGSLWTLPFEMLAYVCLALLALLVGQRLRWFVPTLLVVAIGADLLWRPEQQVVAWGNDLRHIPHFMALFFAGSTLALWGDRVPRVPALLWLLGVYAFFDFTPLRQVLALLFLPLLTIYLCTLRIDPRFELRNDISYGMYLYAFPVQQLLIAKFAGLGFWPTMVLAVLLTGACALVSWRLVEQPALTLKPRRPARAPESDRQRADAVQPGRQIDTA